MVNEADSFMTGPHNCIHNTYEKNYPADLAVRRGAFRLGF